jgi:hypothetical protein
MKLGGLFVCVVAFVACATRANAQSQPFVQITGFAAVPSNTCTDPGASLNVRASGTAAHSDSYAIFVNGTEHYSWRQGEDMSWATAASEPYGLNSDPGSGSYVENTIITGQIVTYSRSNPAGPVFIAGDAVYMSEIRWNCTTGAQIGAIANVDLRSSEVPLPMPWWLMGALGVIGCARIRRLRTE